MAIALASLAAAPILLKIGGELLLWLDVKLNGAAEAGEPHNLI